MDTTKLNTSYTNINKMGFDEIWSGAAFTTNRESLNDLMTKLNKCITDVNEFDKILVLRDKYIEICDKIVEYYGKIASCSSGHTEEQNENGCGTCGYYSSQINTLETQRKTLREEIIGLLGKFAGIDAEVTGAADFSIVLDMLKPEDDLEGNPTSYTEFPLYDQNQYADVKYGNGTLQTSGCGITCAAMVISYYTGTQVTPDMLATSIKWTGNDKTMEAALDQYGIINANNWRHENTFEERSDYYYFDDVKQKLEEGYTAIFLMKEGNFTGGEHFILATGVTEDGRILINDPNGNNYNKGNPVLVDGFENGFEDSAFSGQWSGCWLIEPPEDYKKRTQGEE